MSSIPMYSKQLVLEHIPLFISFLQEVKENVLFKEKIKKEIDVYNFIYENENNVVKDINLFLNDKKPNLEETSKVIIEIFVKLIVNDNESDKPPRITELNFSKIYVVYYLFLLETCNENLFRPYGDNGADAIEIYADLLNEEGIDEINFDELVLNAHENITYNIFLSLREPVYNYLTRMATVTQNITEQKGLETISTLRKLPEDTQGIIGDFLQMPVKGGRKSRRNAKGRTTRRSSTRKMKNRK